MARLQETAYPQLKSAYSEKELQELFTPTQDEIALMENATRLSSPETQLCFTVLLKCYQCLGQPVLLQDIPKQIMNHIQNYLKISLPEQTLSYNKSTRQRHIEIIRNYLQISNDNHKRKLCMKKAALDAAETKENLADIINNIIDCLIQERFELPAYQSLVRLARASRKIMNQHYYGLLSSGLSAQTKAFIDSLFQVPKQANENLINNTLLFSRNSPWSYIKQEASNPTTRHIQVFVQRLNWLLELKQKIIFDINTIPAARLEQFVSEALALDAADMQKLKASHGYALAVILICFKSATAIDDLCSTLILWVRKFHTYAKDALDAYRKEQAQETDQLIQLLYQLAVGVKESTSSQERLSMLDQHLTPKAEAVIAQCERHLAYANDNYYSFMLKPYQNKRNILLKILDHLGLFSSTQDASLEEALQFIKRHRKTHQTWVPVTEEDSQGNKKTLDLSWLSEKWFTMVTGKTMSGKVTNVETIHRHYFEMAVINEVAEALDAGDVYVANAYAFDDPHKQLMSWEEFHEEIDNYCSLIKLPAQPEAFIEQLQRSFRETAQRVDENAKNNPYLSIENGLPSLKKIPSKETPSNVKQISQKIADLMPQTNIVDVILDVEKSLNLSIHLKPISGLEAKTKDQDLRFVGTSFSYGCNIGPTEGSRCLQRFSRKQIAWLFNHQTTEYKLDYLNTKVINQYNQFEMPLHWGNGKSASVDGTYWDMYKKNLFAAHHIRYGQFGGIGYYHVSDKYIALYGNFISCGVHESHYLFDGIINNESDIQPDKIHGDTGAQTEVAFAFGYLLAIQLMPRIRNFKHLYYYKPSKSDQFQHINALFCDQSIDWEFIQLHYHDMLRAAMSVRAGKIKPSTLMRRLCSKTRKNKLYYAFKELGRVIRTIFLLNYIDDPLMRQMIQAGTCKSEEFNEFIAWVRFGDGGAVGDNMRFNQQKIIKFGHLVANMVVLHVTANMTKAVNQLRKAGEEVPDEVLAEFSPYRREHINRFGIFPMDGERQAMELEYELVK